MTPIRRIAAVGAPALWLVAAMLLAPAASTCDSADESGLATAAAAPRGWIGPEGEPLPFSSDEELLAFLREAEVVSIKEMSVGVTKARVVTLALGEVRARAAFHDHHLIKERQRLVDGTTVMFFRDSYLNQPAAFEISRLLGMTNTPPSAVREIDGSTGSLQLWVEEAMMERDRRRDGLQFPDRIRAYRQVYDMDIFDALINNRDRSQTNFLWDQDWALWMIDHTRSFGREQKVLETRSIRRCSRRLWERLQTLDADHVEALLAPYMGKLERDAVMERQADLVRMIRAKIEQEGEKSVLFSYDDPGAVEVVQED